MRNHLKRRGAIALLSAVAIATVTAATARTPARPPQPTEGYDWAMRTTDESGRRWAVLAYEVPNTDDQPLRFTCEGEDSIVAGVHGGDAGLTRITLSSGDQTVTLPGVSEVDGEVDIASFNALPMRGDSAFLAAFARNGWLRLTINGQTRAMAATPDGRGNIGRFLTYCNTGEL